MINKVILIGRLGNDPDMIVTETGTSITNFSLATGRKYINKAGEKVEQTDWHRIVTFNKTAELAEKYLKKGSLVFIEGEIRYRQYEKDGEKKYITEIYVNSLRFLDTKRESGAQEKAEQQENTYYSNNEADPF